MTTQVRHLPEDHRFEIEIDGTRAGLAAYRMTDGRWVFTHTEVDDGHEGEGLGSQLVQGALDHVRGEGGRIVPLCPFVRSWVERHREYADLVDQEMLAELE